MDKINHLNPLNAVSPPNPPGSVTPTQLSVSDEKSHDVATTYFQSLSNTPVGSGLSAIRALKDRNIKQEAFTNDSKLSFEIESLINSDDESIVETEISQDETDDSNLYSTDSKEVMDIVDHLKKNQPIKKKSKLTELAESKWKGANREINKRVQDHLGKYYQKGCTEIKGTIRDKFDRMTINGKRAKVRFENIDEGISDTKLVKINGYNAYVVKKLALPEKLMKKPEIMEQFAAIFVEGLKNYGSMVEKLDEFLTHTIGEFFDKLIAPYYTGANREKVAEIVGKHLGVYVPEVEIVKTSGDKIYTCHKFVENQGTLLDFKSTPEKIKEQPLQDIYLLDAFVKNVDRHLNNIVVTEDGTAIPIDHSLSLQGSKKAYISTMYTTFQNNSLAAMPTHANLPLTNDSIKKIEDFNVDQVIANARVVENLILEEDVRNGLKERVKRAKEAIKIPGITAENFLFATIEPKCLMALQKNPRITRSELIQFLLKK
jgi:hypothetical protein